jgi:hypothetical protein
MPTERKSRACEDSMKMGERSTGFAVASASQKQGRWRSMTPGGLASLPRTLNWLAPSGKLHPAQDSRDQM